MFASFLDGDPRDREVAIALFIEDPGTRRPDAARISMPQVTLVLGGIKAQMGREPHSVQTVETAKGGELERRQVGEEVVRQMAMGGEGWFAFAASTIRVEVSWRLSPV